MPRSSWSAKDERQYAHIKASCVTKRGKRSKKLCARIAAATVNKARGKKRGKKTLGCGCGSSKVIPAR